MELFVDPHVCDGLEHTDKRRRGSEIAIQRGMITQEVNTERKKNSTPPWLMSGPAGRRGDAGHGLGGIRQKKADRKREKKRAGE